MTANLIGSILVTNLNNKNTIDSEVIEINESVIITPIINIETKVALSFKDKENSKIYKEIISNVNAYANDKQFIKFSIGSNRSVLMSNEWYRIEKFDIDNYSCTLCNPLCDELTILITE